MAHVPAAEMQRKAGPCVYNIDPRGGVSQRWPHEPVCSVSPHPSPLPQKSVLETQESRNGPIWPLQKDTSSQKEPQPTHGGHEKGQSLLQHEDH